MLQAIATMNCVCYCVLRPGCVYRVSVTRSSAESDVFPSNRTGGAIEGDVFQLPSCDMPGTGKGRASVKASEAISI